MGFIDGSIINLCTFPGIFVHQLIYLAACKYYKVEAAFSLFDFTQFLSADLVKIGESDSQRLGAKIGRLASIGSALSCCTLGAINEFTPKGSVVEGVILWIAVSIGIHSFPFRKSGGGRVLSFVWMDAFYGLLLYFIGKLPLGFLGVSHFGL